MRLLWGASGSSMGILCDSYGILTGFLCGSYVVSPMIFLWDFCGVPMGFP